MRQCISFQLLVSIVQNACGKHLEKIDLSVDTFFENIFFFLSQRKYTFFVAI